jgi:MarR family transcriptional regulator, organic hydroperoxide resistance regulator
MASTARARGRASPAQEAWVLLRRLLMGEKRRFVSSASELDLHPAQAGALLQMEPGEPLPMHELASMLACDNSNVTGIVDRLEARGLVARQAYAQDRRVKHIVLTPLGVELREAMRSRMAYAPAALGRLSAAEQRQLRDLLRKALEA